jgi:hypothetical protein
MLQSALKGCVTGLCVMCHRVPISVEKGAHTRNMSPQLIEICSDFG